MRRAALAFSIAAALLATAEVRAANPPGALDVPPSNVIPAPVDVAPVAPRADRPADPTGNPLWAIPLSSLTATRERPLFLPSRRAPAPGVVGTPVVVAPPPPSTEPDQPPLTLVGAIASDTEGFAVFLDQATNNVVRLKTGQDHMGWVLRSVKGREATLEKNRRTATLTLPVPTAVSLGEPPNMPVPPMPPMPTRGGGPSLPRPPGPAGAPMPPGPPGHPTLGAPATGIPGDPRPLADQL